MMTTVEGWRNDTIRREQATAQGDREARQRGLKWLERVRWVVDLPPTTPVHDTATLVTPGIRYVNIAALSVATTFARLTWVRVEAAGRAELDGLTVADLYARAEAQRTTNLTQNDFLVLAVRADERGYLGRWFLKPSDLLNQAVLPQASDKHLGAWALDGTGDLFVAGLPYTSPKDAVYKVTQAWIVGGRRKTLPWDQEGWR
jgi:hypothetical protein